MWSEFNTLKNPRGLLTFKECDILFCCLKVFEPVHIDVERLIMLADPAKENSAFFITACKDERRGIGWVFVETDLYQEFSLQLTVHREATQNTLCFVKRRLIQELQQLLSCLEHYSYVDGHVNTPVKHSQFDVMSTWALLVPSFPGCDESRWIWAK